MDYTRTRTESMHHYPIVTRTKMTDHTTKRPMMRPRAQTYDITSPAEKPWTQLAQTYTWVVQQEFAKLEKKNRKTEKWVIEQLELLPDRPNRRIGKNEATRPPHKKTLEELMGGYEVEADKWMRQEAEARRAAIEREKEKARAIEKDIRRIQARVQQKKEYERQKLAEERLKATEAQKARAKQERARANVASMDVWCKYESRWAHITNNSEPLNFRTIPWPLVSTPTSAKDIVPAEITAFLLSPLHSQSLTRKERIRGALLRWHPDRFRKYLVKVVEEDRKAVEEGAGIVARCLNELMERETRVSRHSTKENKA